MVRLSLNYTWAILFCVRNMNPNRRTGGTMIKTHEQIKHELYGLINNYWKNIESAFRKSGYELTISAKVVLEQKDGSILISPSIEFYPAGWCRS